MDSKERYEKAVEGLSQAIFHLTWLGYFWGFRGVIILEEIRSWYVIHRLGDNEANTLSARSSTYYAAAGNAKARAAKSFFVKPLWLVLAVLCFARSLRLSNRLVRLVGIKNMNSDQLDVRSHVLRKVGKHEEALECIDEALFRTNVSMNSRALLSMGRLESLAKIGRNAEAEVASWGVRSFLKCLVPVSTEVRLLRSLAAYNRGLGKEDEALKLYEEAKILASRDALGDQIKKIEASL